jgi:hypothetical protein
MSYKTEQYSRAEAIVKARNIFGDDAGNGFFRGKNYPFVLQNGINNLYPTLRSEIIEYFMKNKIAWWGGFSPTNHTLSSQIACINHLFSIRCDKESVLKIVQRIVPDIADVLIIGTDKYKPEYIQFEAVSDTDRLNEQTSTRGSNCTSLDALIYAILNDGRKTLVPIEWKYVESYGNDDKAKGEKGATRKARYTDLINSSNQLVSNSHDVYYYEPFYQLMRQTLWAEQMVTYKDSETIQADDYIHLHIIPTENGELLRKPYPCSGKGLEETWRKCLKNQEKYRIVTPRDLLAPLDRQKYKDLFNYLEIRYW